MENAVSLSQELGFGKGQDQIKKQVDRSQDISEILILSTHLRPAGIISATGEEKSQVA